MYTAVEEEGEEKGRTQWRTAAAAAVTAVLYISCDRYWLDEYRERSG